MLSAIPRNIAKKDNRKRSRDERISPGDKALEEQFSCQEQAYQRAFRKGSDS